MQKKLTRFNKWHGILFAATLYFHLEDYRLTMIALQLGHGEANPVISTLFKVLGIPFTATLTSLVLIIMLVLIYKNKKLNKYFNSFLITILVIMAGIFIRDVAILF